MIRPFAIRPFSSFSRLSQYFNAAKNESAEDKNTEHLIEALRIKREFAEHTAKVNKAQ